jgi:hypothetical protein
MNYRLEEEGDMEDVEENIKIVLWPIHLKKATLTMNLM